jgi:DNA modification methylase
MEVKVPVSDQIITNDYALYNGDCVEVVADLPSNSVDMAVYSPPFAGLFQYSGDERDMSNCSNYDQFYQQYSFLIDHLYRVTKPGRINAVHCMDIGTDSRSVPYMTFQATSSGFTRRQALSSWADG